MCDGDVDTAREWEDLTLRLQHISPFPEIGAATAHSLLPVGPVGIGKPYVTGWRHGCLL